MASKSEQSFGARLRKFQDAIEYTRSWVGYQPPRKEESIAELDKLVQNVTNSNDAETSKQVQYGNAVAVRQKLFTKEDGSVDKLLVKIRGAVEAQYGKTSSHAKQVAALITTMRKSKLIKLPADPANPTAAKAVSQSERSFGSRTQYFSDIVTTLSEAPGYTSSNTAITLLALQDKVKELHSANNTVAAQVQQIAAERRTRIDHYNDVNERFKRMKAYAKSQYGTNSPEYKSLISLK